MIQHSDPLVESVGAEIASALVDMERLFKPGMRLTLVARRPSHPDGSQDIIITSDNLGNVAAALKIRIEADAPGPQRKEPTP